jgi:pimeloyl-ACP methyl ester carboxylesterase
MKKVILWTIGTFIILSGLWLIKEKVFNNVKPLSINQDGFKANYFKKGSGTGKTTIIILGGGPYGDYWGSEFANAGHIGLSLPYYREEGLPGKIEEISLVYFEKAVDWLISQPEVNRDKIIVMGGSTSAELALLLASTFPDKIKGVVALCPSSVSWSNTVFPWSSDEIKSKWMLDGQPIPYVAMEKIKGNETNKIETLSYWNKGLDDTLQVRKAAIKVERIGGPILLITPVDDKVWPSVRMSDMIMKRREENNFRFKYENIKYENAGHTVMSQKYRSMANFPFNLLSVTEDKGTMKIGDKVYEFEYGGTPEGNLAGQIDSRERIMEFLNKLK